MRRMLVFFVVLTVALSVVLYLRLKSQQLAATRATGGSATIEGTEVDIVARIPGRIAVIHAEEGEVVKQGQVLVELDCADQKAALAQADARVAALDVALSAAKLNTALAEQGVKTALRQTDAAKATARASRSQRKAIEVQRAAAERAARRLDKLKGAGVASEQLWDQTQSQSSGLSEQARAFSEAARAADAQRAVVEEGATSAELQVKVAEVRVTAAERELDVARAARAQVQANVAECTLKAPRDGVVQVRSFEPGEAVMPGSRLLTLIDAREVTATFYVPNAELAAAKPGRAVEVRPDAYGERRFSGIISRVSPSAEFTPRNIQTRDDRDRLVYAVDVKIPNEDGALRPGMPVEIAIPGTELR